MARYKIYPVRFSFPNSVICNRFLHIPLALMATKAANAQARCQAGAAVAWPQSDPHILPPLREPRIGCVSAETSYRLSLTSRTSSVAGVSPVDSKNSADLDEQEAR